MKISGLTIFFMFSIAFSGAAFAKSFTDNSDNTVADNETSLVWQQSESALMTWEDAISYCENLSLGGDTAWRLPSRRELNSLVDHTKFDPALAGAYFPDVHSFVYWSSTTIAGATPKAWGVNFDEGGVTAYGKPDLYHVRCVRAGN